MKSILLMALIGSGAADQVALSPKAAFTGTCLQGQWAPKNDPEGCKHPTGPKFLPGQKIPTPTGETIPYVVLPDRAGISFTDWDGQKIAYLIKVLSENEMQVEITYNGLADEFDEPVVHRRCEGF